MFAIVLLFSCALATYSEGSVKSKVLGREVAYSYYLPKSFVNGVDLPVVYLFHGLTSDNHAYESVGIEGYLDQMFEKKIFDPFIAIIPDGNASFFVNSAAGNCDYETFFITEFIPEIEKKIGCGKSKNKRALMGYSMGGYAAFYYQFTHKDMFGAASAISPAAFGKGAFELIDKYAHNLTDYSKYVNKFKEIFANDSYAYQMSLRGIVQSHDDGYFNGPLYRLSCGDEKGLQYLIEELHDEMNGKKIKHEFVKTEDEHKMSNFQKQFNASYYLFDEFFKNGPSKEDSSVVESSSSSTNNLIVLAVFLVMMALF